MLINNSTFNTKSPNVDMRVLDLNTHEEVSDSQIGQELELVIEFKTKNSKCKRIKTSTSAKYTSFRYSRYMGQSLGCDDRKKRRVHIPLGRQGLPHKFKYLPATRESCYGDVEKVSRCLPSVQVCFVAFCAV